MCACGVFVDNFSCSIFKHHPFRVAHLSFVSSSYQMILHCICFTRVTFCHSHPIFPSQFQLKCAQTAKSLNFATLTSPQRYPCICQIWMKKNQWIWSIATFPNYNTLLSDKILWSSLQSYNEYEYTSVGREYPYLHEINSSLNRKCIRTLSRLEGSKNTLG